MYIFQIIINVKTAPYQLRDNPRILLRNEIRTNNKYNWNLNHRRSPTNVFRAPVKQIFPEFKKKQYFYHFGTTAACRSAKICRVGNCRIQKRRLDDKVDERDTAVPLGSTIDQQDKFDPVFLCRLVRLRVSQSRPPFRRGDASYSQLNHPAIDLAYLNQRLIPCNESAAPCTNRLRDALLPGNRRSRVDLIRAAN